MTNGSKSSRVLFWCNAVIGFLAVILSGFAGYALASPTHIADFLTVLIPKSAFLATLVFALALTLITGLAVCSAKTRSKAGLGVYLAISLCALLAELTLAFYILTNLGVIEGAKAQDVAAELRGTIGGVEAGILQLATENPAMWIETQDSLKCCGYDADTAARAGIATGATCSTDPSHYCKELLLESLESSGLYVAISACSLAFVQLVCIFAAARLACCVSDRGALLEAWLPTAEEVSGSSAAARKDLEAGEASGAALVPADGAQGMTYA